MASSVKMTCKHCEGPADALHTPRECLALQDASAAYGQDERAQLATIGAIIDTAGGGVAAAVALHELGWLKGKRGS